MENNKEWKHHNRQPEQNQDADCRPDEQLYIFIENALLPAMMPKHYFLFTHDTSIGKFTCPNGIGKFKISLTEEEMFTACHKLDVVNFVVIRSHGEPYQSPFSITNHQPSVN